MARSEEVLFIYPFYEETNLNFIVIILNTFLARSDCIKIFPEISYKLTKNGKFFFIILKWLTDSQTMFSFVDILIITRPKSASKNNF